MNENKNEINVTSAPVLALTERPLFPETFTTLMIARPSTMPSKKMAAYSWLY